MKLRAKAALYPSDALPVQVQQAHVGSKRLNPVADILHVAMAAVRL
jgi:hypothetical protein